MREGISAEKKYPDNLFRINYEELCSKDSNIFRKLVRFLELDENDDVFMEYARETLKQPSPKNEFPLHPSIEAPFRETMKLCGY
jgi:hypothetical protein